MPSTSKAQQRFMGLVHAYKKGEVKGSEVSNAIKKAAKSMKNKSVKDYASTEHNGLPKKVKEEGFGGQLKGKDKLKFEKARKANGEQLGYTLSDTPDVKEERDYKEEYKKYGSSTKSKKYRAELNQYNRKKGTYGNGDGKDASHKGGKIVGFEKESTNRGRAEKSRLKKESSSAYGKSIEKIANDKKLKSISKKDRGLLLKIAKLMKKANESVNEKFDPIKLDKHLLKAIGYLQQARKFAKAKRPGAVYDRVGDAKFELDYHGRKYMESVNEEWTLYTTTRYGKKLQKLKSYKSKKAAAIALGKLSAKLDTPRFPKNVDGLMIIDESIQLPQGMKLGKVFTGHGKSFVKEESVNEDVGVETILGGIVQAIQKAGLKPKSAKLMKSGFKVSKRDKVGFVIDVEIRGFDKKEIHKMQFEVERGMLYLILNNKPVKLGKWTMGTMVTKNLKKIALTLSGQKGSPKRIA